jgi:hypothetical protein
MTQRSQRTNRAEHLSAAALMHYFIHDSGEPSALNQERHVALDTEIKKEQEFIQHATARSVALDTNTVPGQYTRDLSGLTRAKLAVRAVNNWKLMSKTHFMRGGTLGKALTSGNKSNGALKLGTHVQGWHMLSRHCNDAKERKKRRDSLRDQAGKPKPNVLSLAVAMYGKFDRQRLNKVIESDMQQRSVNKSKTVIDPLDLSNELEALEALTLEYAPEIRGWYIRYSSQKGMGAGEWCLFVKQIKVLSKSFRLVDIDLVRVASGAGDGDGMLDPQEFVEALIRLAIKRYTTGSKGKGTRNEALPYSDDEDNELDSDTEEKDRKQQVAAAAALAALASDKSKKAVDRMKRLLIDNVKKHAHVVDIDSFKTKFADEDVQSVLVKRRRWLLGKFREYCAGDGAQASSSSQAMYTMNLVEWNQFLKEHMMFDHRFKNRMSATVFVCAQAPHAMDEAGSLEDALESNQELIYQEFLEAIVALAHFRLPDPFVPLSSRVSTMLDAMNEAKPLNRYFASTRFSKNTVQAANATVAAVGTAAFGET